MGRVPPEPRIQRPAAAVQKHVQGGAGHRCAVHGGAAHGAEQTSRGGRLRPERSDQASAVIKAPGQEARQSQHDKKTRACVRIHRAVRQNNKVDFTV